MNMIVGPKIWDLAPNEIKQSETLNVFKESFYKKLNCEDNKSKK